MKNIKRYTKAIKDKVIDKTANVISAPSRLKSKLKQKRAESDYKVLKGARSYKGAPNFDDEGRPTDAFKMRTMADAVKTRYGKKK